MLDPVGADTKTAQVLSLGTYTLVLGRGVVDSLPIGWNPASHKENKMRRMLMIVLFCFLLSITVNVFAGVEPSPWRLPSSGGFDNPIFWVLFNPQPEPPGKWDTSNQFAPVFTTYSDATGEFFLGVGMQDAQTGQGFASTLNVLTYSILNAAGGIAYKAEFTFTLAGISGPGSLVMFNPQPEPPGIPYALDGISFYPNDPTTGRRFSVSEGTEVDMTFRLYDSVGGHLALESVPEPSTILLLSLGLASLIGCGWRHGRI